jgi:hypothetical protein
MIYYAIKVLVSAIIIVLISEISKRSSFTASILASVPLLSFLAFIWIYFETKDVAKIADLSINIFWLVIPSLIFFIIFPLMLRKGINFYLSISLSAAIMVVFYFLMVLLLKKVGIKF